MLWIQSFQLRGCLLRKGQKDKVNAFIERKDKIIPGSIAGVALLRPPKQTTELPVAPFNMLS